MSNSFKYDTIIFPYLFLELESVPSLESVGDVMINVVLHNDRLTMTDYISRRVAK